MFDSNPVDTLVFDFRGNTGGNSSVINPVLVGFQQRIAAIVANPNFRVYDVIDGGTFSSGLDDAMELQTTAGQAAVVFPAFANALVTIGSPSGGPPAGFGEVQPFTLPYLGLSGQYSTTYHPLPQFIPPWQFVQPANAGFEPFDGLLCAPRSRLGGYLCTVRRVASASIGRDGRC
jgi:hypothetical protein